MANQEFTKPQSVGVRMPETPPVGGLFDEEPKKSEWLDLPATPVPGKYGAFPYNHAPVLLTPDGEIGVVAQWQTSRRVTRARWEHYGFWADRNRGGKPVGFEPLGYKEIKE